MIESLIKYLGEYLKWMAQLNLRQKYWAFAHFVVPCLMACVAIGFGDLGLLEGDELSMTAIPLLTEAEAKGDQVIVKRKNGYVFIIDSTSGEYAIPWKAELGRIFLSIDKDTLDSNNKKLEFNKNNLCIDMPLLGLSEPLAIVAGGEPLGSVLTPGRQSSLRNYHLQPKRSALLAMWAAIAAILGFGITIGSFRMDGQKVACKECD